MTTRPNKPKTMTTKTLNTLQQQALLDICNHLSDPVPSQKAYGLLGSAGTGKSYTISQLFKAMPDIGYKSIFMTPTHTAKKVLQGFLDAEGLFIPVMTIHSALGISVKESEGRKRSEKKNSKPATQYRYWFIDECSMIDSELALEIFTTAKIYGCYVTVLGDRLQLPPVNQTDNSFPVLDRWLKDSIELTEPMRYSGAITDFVERSKLCVREGILYSPLSQLNKHSGDSTAPRQISKGDILPLFIEGKSQVLAYTNNTVQKYNFAIRSKIMDIDEKYDDFLIDEAVVANDVLVDSFGDILATNGSILEVLYSEKTKVKDEYDAYSLTLCLQDEPTNQFIATVIARTALKAYEKQLNSLKKYACVCGYEKKGQAWREYYKFKAINAPIRHPYACTIHKSQGQSITNPILVNDFSFLKDPFMQPRLWYVGMSRTKKNLYIATN